ncbi:MAG: hypothetical protein FWF87_07325 [Synergistaceae bacterium]|nr:hypothetical protein [Synergistaceae bacterium]
MMNNNPVEKELNVIRADFYEKTKDMSPNERIAYIKEQTELVHEKFGINTIEKAYNDAPIKKEAVLS